MGLLLGLPSLASGSDPRPTQKDFEWLQPKFSDLNIIDKPYGFKLETTSVQFSFDLPSSVQSFMIPNQPPSPSSFSSSLSDQPPMTSDQPSSLSDQSPMTSSPSFPFEQLSSQLESLKSQINDNYSITLRFFITVIGLIVAVIGLIFNMNGRIDNLYTDLGNKIDNGNQEMRELINSSIRDFNSRIDNVNGRIDNMYKAPSIEN